MRKKALWSVVSGLMVLSLMAAACKQPPAPTTLTTPGAATIPVVLTETSLIPVTVYKLPGCDCCSRHGAYLESAGFQVTASYVISDSSLRERFQVPPEMQSCHITTVSGYFVEGHVPVEAITKLLKEKPAIDGIVLPGMPAGSPGMPGQQEAAFVIYAVSHGQISEFLRIEPK